MSEHDHWTSQLELYLDGLLTGENLHAFKRRLNEDEQLQAALKQQRRINQVLRQRLSPPAQAVTQEWINSISLNGHASSADEVPQPIAMPEANGGTPSKRKPSLRLGPRHYALAAAVLLVVIGGWVGWTLLNSGGGTSQPSGFAKGPPRMPIDEYFERKAADGFKPAWVCEDDEQFKDSFRETLGQAVLIAQLPDNVSMFGLDYNNCLSARTLSVLMKVNDQGVVVLVDRIDRDNGIPELPAPLKAFRRELDQLVMYEITPLDAPRTLEYFFNPDAPSGATDPDQSN